MFTLATLPALLFASHGLAVPTPAKDSSADLAKRQNQPSFGGWDQGQNVTEFIAELYDQVNPIDRDVLLPKDGFVFDFLSESFRLQRAMTSVAIPLLTPCRSTQLWWRWKRRRTDPRR